MRAVVLLSGGLDSYTSAAIAAHDGFTLCALTVLYGQRHAQEIAAARAVAKALGVERHLELEIDLRSIGGSSLTADLPVPEGRDLASDQIPSTYVKLDEQKAKATMRLLELLDDHEDVQNVWSNFDVPEEMLESE